MFALMTYVNEHSEVYNSAQLEAIAQMIECDATMQSWNLSNLI